jgi:hypothetical protein
MLDDSSKNFFGDKCKFMGEGGSIPLVNDLEKRFPDAFFLVVGLLGPNSNAHTCNEMLHIPFCKKFVCCLA